MFATNWQLNILPRNHLCIPFLVLCFALTHYARDLSLFYIDMMNLKHILSDVYDYLSKEGFSNLSPGKPFTNIPVDQMIEMTINRSSKEASVLSGKTQNKGAS